MKPLPSDTLQPVSLIIVNYNAGTLLVDCVSSCLADARHVIVVDNASADESLEGLKRVFPNESRLQIIQNNRNMGFSAGCNVGIEVATEPFLLFLNPDCVLAEGSLQLMLENLQADARVGMVGGLLIDPDGTEQAGGRRAVPTPWRSFVRAFGLHCFADRWPRLFYDFHLHKQPLPDAPIEVEAISGACILVKREAINDIGLWDEGYFLHCEDLDWCMRLRRKGWKILFVPDAPVVHHQGACSRSSPIFVEWHKHKGMARFYRKFFRHQYPGVVLWLVMLGVSLRFAAVLTYYTVRRAGRWLGLVRD